MHERHRTLWMSPFSRRTQVLGLVAWLVLAFAASAIGAAGSMQAPAFYARLAQPEWAPPAWLFGPVWTVLYTLMGVAAWLVWRTGGVRARRGPLGLFVGQLVLNALWSWLFFAWRRGALAFVDIVVLVVLVAATLVSFWRVRPLAGGLLVPYLLWVGFACALSYAIWQMNPELLG